MFGIYNVNEQNKNVRLDFYKKFQYVTVCYIIIKNKFSD